MSTILIVGAAWMASQSRLDLSMAYKRCVENFAIAQLESGEPAETLVIAGEAHCHRRLQAVERAVRAQTRAVAARNRGSVPPRMVARLVDESVAQQMADIRDQIHRAVLRNVVVVKARLREDSTLN